MEGPFFVSWLNGRIVLVVVVAVVVVVVVVVIVVTQSSNKPIKATSLMPLALRSTNDTGTDFFLSDVERGNKWLLGKFERKLMCHVVMKQAGFKALFCCVPIMES